MPQYRSTVSSLVLVSALLPGCGSTRADRELVIPYATAGEALAALGRAAQGPDWPDDRILSNASVAVNQRSGSAVVAFGSPADSMTVELRVAGSDAAVPGLISARARAGGFFHDSASDEIDRIARTIERGLNSQVQVRDADGAGTQFEDTSLVLRQGTASTSGGWRILRRGNHRVLEPGP